MCARSEAFHYCTTHGLALIVSVTCLKYNGSECYYSLMTMTVDMSTLFQWIGASICWSNTTDYIVKLLLQLTCCVVDKLGRWWLRVKKCYMMSHVWQCDVWQVTPTLQWERLLICVYTIYGSKFPRLVCTQVTDCARCTHDFNTPPRCAACRALKWVRR